MPSGSFRDRDGSIHALADVKILALIALGREVSSLGDEPMRNRRQIQHESGSDAQRSTAANAPARTFESRVPRGGSR